MIRIHQAPDLPQARLQPDLFEHVGICAIICHARAHGALGELPFTHACPQIRLIHNYDRGHARRLINGFERPAQDPGWQCSRCQAHSPASFETCRHCSVNRNINGAA